jgi:hypothetical protein
MAPLKATLFLNKTEIYMEEYKLCTKVRLDTMLPLISSKLMLKVKLMCLQMKAKYQLFKELLDNKKSELVFLKEL